MFDLISGAYGENIGEHTAHASHMHPPICSTMCPTCQQEHVGDYMDLPVDIRHHVMSLLKEKNNSRLVSARMREDANATTGTLKRSIGAPYHINGEPIAVPPELTALELEIHSSWEIAVPPELTALTCLELEIHSS